MSPGADDTIAIRMALLESAAKARDKRLTDCEEDISTAMDLQLPIARLEVKVVIIMALVLTNLSAVLGLAWAILRSGIIQ